MALKVGQVFYPTIVTFSCFINYKPFYSCYYSTVLKAGVVVTVSHLHPSLLFNIHRAEPYWRKVLVKAINTGLGWKWLIAYYTLAYYTLAYNTLAHYTVTYYTLAYCTLAYSTLAYNTLAYYTLAYYSSLLYTGSLHTSLLTNSFLLTSL
jgi:hypothetical protein